jgi:hypothetical protein
MEEEIPRKVGSAEGRDDSFTPVWRQLAKITGKARRVTLNRFERNLATEEGRLRNQMVFENSMKEVRDGLSAGPLYDVSTGDEASVRAVCVRPSFRGRAEWQVAEWRRVARHKLRLRFSRDHRNDATVVAGGRQSSVLLRITAERMDRFSGEHRRLVRR